MKQTFQVAAIMTGGAFKADGGMSLRFSTQELSVGDKVKAGEFVNQYGWLLFAANEFKDEDIPEENTPVDGWKSPSERLRNVLFALFKAEHPEARGDEFNGFYSGRMEMIIDQIKAKIEKASKK